MLVLGDPRPWGGSARTGDLLQAAAWFGGSRVVGLEAGQAAPQAWAMLSSHERSRAERCRDPLLGQTYACAHAMLRLLLAARIDSSLPPESLVFEAGPAGKPCLQGSPGVQFSLSYRRGVVAFAVHGQPVGIDVERMRDDVDVRGISQRFFTPAEQQFLQGATPADRLTAFFECWTRKEALVKAAGVGIDGLARASTVKSMTSLTDECGREQAYRLEQLTAAPGYALALAVQCAPEARHATAP